MRVLIAPDKFKGSLGAFGVAEEVARGIRDVVPDAIIDVAALADGGEGTADVIARECASDWIACAAHDSLGRAIDARYLWIRDGAVALIQMSEAAGLHRIQADERDVLRANTFGVGEMMLHAVGRGAREIVVGLGGSATNDAGFGMARALGFQFLARTQELRDGPAELTGLTRVVRPNEQFPPIIAASDVQNPLLGENGATRVFGKQKGARESDMPLLESALTKLADVVARDLGCDCRDRPGAGAAGGLGFGLLTFCDAKLRSGFEVVAETIRLRERMMCVDLVVTGEGRLDAQSLQGKAPAGVARLARELNKPVCAVVGESADAAAEAMFDKVFALVRPPIDRTTAIRLTSDLLRERGREIAHLYCTD